MKNKIIVSPSKTFKKKFPIQKKKITFFNEKNTTIILKKIQKFSLKEIKLFFKLSDKKALQVFNYYKNFGQVKAYAIDLFDGLVFKQLELKKIDKEYLQKHLIILDAFYGIIKPYDVISPYRMDFTCKLENVNLKKIWAKEYHKYFKNNKIHNLASKEFSSLLDPNSLINVSLQSKGQIKLHRGKKLNQFLLYQNFK